MLLAALFGALLRIAAALPGNTCQGDGATAAQALLQQQTKNAEMQVSAEMQAPTMSKPGMHIVVEKLLVQLGDKYSQEDLRALDRESSVLLKSLNSGGVLGLFGDLDTLEANPIVQHILQHDPKDVGAALRKTLKTASLPEETAPVVQAIQSALDEGRLIADGQLVRRDLVAVGMDASGVCPTDLPEIQRVQSLFAGECGKVKQMVAVATLGLSLLVLCCCCCCCCCGRAKES